MSADALAHEESETGSAQRQRDGSGNTVDQEFRIYAKGPRGEVQGVASLSLLVESAMSRADVMLLGEFHDDDVAHRVELEVLQLAVQRAAQAQAQSGTRNVVLSLEMLERDVQRVVDEVRKPSFQKINTHGSSGFLCA